MKWRWWEILSAFGQLSAVKMSFTDSVLRNNPWWVWAERSHPFPQLSLQFLRISHLGKQSPRILSWLEMMWEHYQSLLILFRVKYLGFQLASAALQLGLKVFEQGEVGDKAPRLNLLKFGKISFSLLIFWTIKIYIAFSHVTTQIKNSAWQKSPQSPLLAFFLECQLFQRSREARLCSFP